ncbi:hypothetical protein [Streptomyces sp. NPDC057794]|uniref:hypothetical protein n=1 Tax=Streptomyces sp. NPDC057794 TaxID=3346251 RepID=UPI003684FEB6
MTYPGHPGDPLGLLKFAAAKASLPRQEVLVAAQTRQVHAALGDEREAERHPVGPEPRATAVTAAQSGRTSTVGRGEVGAGAVQACRWRHRLAAKTATASSGRTSATARAGR